MSKLHYCLNGVPVTGQVIEYQQSRKSEDYLWVQLYYDNYKDHWYNQLSDYMDRITFESDYDYKLARAVDTFSGTKAAVIAKEKGYTNLGAFNGWFYKILSNWKSNVKTSAFRLKKRPSVVCPVCGRSVARITVDHLQHYKAIKDLPKFRVWKGDIYEVCTTPRIYVTTWGKKTAAKWNALLRKDTKALTPFKHRTHCPWKLKDGQRGVLCPFTRKIIPYVDEAYIRTLPKKYSRYAQPMSWEDFIETHPRARIQSEVYDLGYVYGSDENTDLAERISRDWRLHNIPEAMDYEKIKSKRIPVEYENAFNAIETFASGDTEQSILKLIASGYSFDDIAETLEIEKKVVKNCVKAFRGDDDLKSRLLEV